MKTNSLGKNHGSDRFGWVWITSVWFGTVRRKEWAHTKDAEVAKAETSMDIGRWIMDRTARSEVLALPSGIFSPAGLRGADFDLKSSQAAFLTSQVRDESGAH
jgi:hypothetical protein